VSLDYEKLLRDIGFVDPTRGYKLRHVALDCTLYFNRKSSGEVYFTAYRRDAHRFSADLWVQLPPQQRKDDDPKFLTVRPKPGKDRAAFESLLSGRYVTREAQDEEQEVRLRQRMDIGPTEIERLTKARRGQGLFRDNVFNVESACRVTGVADPALLIASHIKPWRDSDDREKLDGHNGLLLSPHIDRLFDRGYLTFEDDGHIRITRLLDPAVLARWGIPAEAKVGAFAPEQRMYLEYHRSNVYLGGHGLADDED
jgi:hypothetical protein